LWKALDIRWGFAAVCTDDGVGGLLNARKVAETMSKRITAMNHGQGFAANLSTAIFGCAGKLVRIAGSTTHVSGRFAFWNGLSTGKANPRVVSAIVFSWLITLPCAEDLSGLIY